MREICPRLLLLHIARTIANIILSLMMTKDAKENVAIKLSVSINLFIKIVRPVYIADNKQAAINIFGEVISAQIALSKNLTYELASKLILNNNSTKRLPASKLKGKLFNNKTNYFKSYIRRLQF